MGFFVRCNTLSDASQTYDVLCGDLESNPETWVELLNAISRDQAWDVRDRLATIVIQAKQFNEDGD